jgi:hypothetical protein
MATFVHIADERDSLAIRRNGLTLPKVHWKAAESERHKGGVFALPVVEDFMLSHQWVRELKRRGHRSAVGIYFRIADNEVVWAGLYNKDKVQMTAAQATALLRQERLLGFEVVIPRSILAAEITAVRSVPHVGWRFSPQAKGSRPFCLCKYCNRGEIKNRKMRKRLDPTGENA